MEISQEEVTTLEQALNLFKKDKNDKKKRILLLINRDGEPRYISLPILTDYPNICYELGFKCFFPFLVKQKC
jgi:hypothetical protein